MTDPDPIQEAVNRLLALTGGEFLPADEDPV
jgi:hypothetical protein